MKKEEYIWDYRDPYQWMERVKNSSFPPMMVQVALTGGFHGKESNPNIPETAEEQADQVYDAYKAGATVVHVHARDPEDNGQTTKSPEDYSRVNRMIRERCPDIVINNTTGGGPTMKAEERMACLFAEHKPDIASLNPGPFMVNYQRPERPASVPHPKESVLIDVAMPVTYGEVFRFAEQMRERGIKPEVELFHPGHFWVVRELIKKGLLTPPYVVQLVMGFQTSSFPTPWNVLSSISELPQDSIFIIPGVGAFQLPMTTMAIIMGGHVRVGMEDNVFYRRGELVNSNAQLVERVVRMGLEMNRIIATPSQTREMLGLPQIA